MRRKSKPRPAEKPAETPAWGPNRGLLVVAALLAASGLAWFLFWPDSQPEVAEVPPPPPPATRSAVEDPGLAVWRIQKDVPTWQAPQANNPVVPDPERDNDPTRDLSSYVPRGGKPSMAEVITRLNEAGVHTGLGAFSPPGTRPPLIGLAVPEDFALPPGYVRHHQATDDGQRIEAILMFAPDFQLLDAQQQPVEMPKDRVVPQELAPPGLPIRRIVIPLPAAGPN